MVLRWLIERNVVVISKIRSSRADGARISACSASPSRDEMARIATLDTGATLFFDHRDPAMVSPIGNRPIHD